MHKKVVAVEEEEEEEEEVAVKKTTSHAEISAPHTKCTELKNMRFGRWLWRSDIRGQRHKLKNCRTQICPLQDILFRPPFRANHWDDQE